MSDFFQVLAMFRKRLGEPLTVVILGFILVAIIVAGILGGWQANNFFWKIPAENPNLWRYLEKHVMPAIVVGGFIFLGLLIVIAAWKISLAGLPMEHSKDSSAPKTEMAIDPAREFDRVRAIARSLPPGELKVLSEIASGGPQSVLSPDLNLLNLFYSGLIESIGKSLIGEQVIALHPDRKMAILEYFTKHEAPQPKNASPGSASPDDWAQHGALSQFDWDLYRLLGVANVVLGDAARDFGDFPTLKPTINSLGAVYNATLNIFKINHAALEAGTNPDPALMEVAFATLRTALKATMKNLYELLNNDSPPDAPKT
jgi:hypothetical protein